MNSIDQRPGQINSNISLRTFITPMKNTNYQKIKLTASLFLIFCGSGHHPMNSYKLSNTPIQIHNSFTALVKWTMSCVRSFMHPIISEVTWNELTFLIKYHLDKFKWKPKWECNIRNKMPGFGMSWLTCRQFQVLDGCRRLCLCEWAIALLNWVLL